MLTFLFCSLSHAQQSSAPMHSWTHKHMHAHTDKHTLQSWEKCHSYHKKIGKKTFFSEGPQGTSLECPSFCHCLCASCGFWLLSQHLVSALFPPTSFSRKSKDAVLSYFWRAIILCFPGGFWIFGASQMVVEYYIGPIVSPYHGVRKE